MFPILNPNQIKALDAFTIKQENISSLDLMERASEQVFLEITRLFPQLKKAIVFCGNGNNGGDGLVVARFLHENKCPIRVVLQGEATKRTDENQINLEKVKTLGIEILIWNTTTKNSISDFCDSETLLIDALFGNGLSRTPKENVKEIIQFSSSLSAKRLAIDMPSGLFAEAEVQEMDCVFKADYTLTFQVPKLNLLNPDYSDFAGELSVLDIGLNEGFIQKQESNAFWVDTLPTSKLSQKRKKYSSKHDFGHALLIVGSERKTGAAIISTKACLRSGAGLTTVHIPASCKTALNISAPEAMLQLDLNEKFISDLPDFRYKTAIGIGPGIDVNPETEKVVFEVLKSDLPKVIDADALNILSKNKDWLSYLNSKTILTPHYKEFDRLTKEHSTWTDRIASARQFSKENRCILVLKSAYSMTFSTDGKVFYNSTGNPALAKGGSGDVLTGIITSFLAQGLNPLEAVLSGVYIHGQAADMAVLEMNERAVLASDVLDYLKFV